jgi:hypothetical protein
MPKVAAILGVSILYNIIDKINCLGKNQYKLLILVSYQIV